MSEGRKGKEMKSHLRAVIPVCLVIIIIFSTSAGCIDKGIADSLVDLVNQDDGPGYVWEPLLEKSGIFILEPNPDAEIDPVSIATKVAENISNLDPVQTVENLKVIMNEENLSMHKYQYSFYVFENTRVMNVELVGTFVTSIGSGTQSGGYMELTIINPRDKSQTYPITQLGEKQMYTYAQEPEEGEWKLELQGVGLQPPGDLIYSGKWDLSVRAERLLEE